jgi:hypothetical protein
MSDWRKQLACRLEEIRERSRPLPSYERNHSDRDEIRRRAEDDFYSLYLAMGGSAAASNHLSCVFHEDNDPSAEIWGGQYHCWSCDERLGPFDFVMRVRGCDFRAALDYLARFCGVELEPGRKISRAERIAIEWSV